jgi:CRP-like cAMP-binding protein
MFNPFKKTYSEDELEKITYLSKVFLFENLTQEEIATFVPYIYERGYSDQEVVFFRKDPSHALYILRHGRVQINVDINDTFEKLVYIEPGTAFGESCLMHNKVRGANAIVVSEEANFYVIPQVNIFDIFDGNIEIRAKMMETLANFYNDIHSNMISAYRSSSGFFHLADLYSD